MCSTRNKILTILLLILNPFTFSSYGQLGISFDLKKPKEFEERKLRSERSEEKKFTLPRRFIQNTVTHYNYFFNANNKLNEVIERAKAAHVDDYSQLLPFYNYTLDATSSDKIQLDSVSYKSQSGIALHDLRNDWIDNLYLLWGAAYYLRKDFDSAYMMFQFINYAFAEKEKDGYYKTIGSSRDGNSAFSIATKEKTSLPRQIFSTPPSRNESFIWQIRNFLAQDQFAEAASLIVTLRNDPVFPKRLHKDLEEVQALWFYKQNMWDSAAAHLEKALDNAENKNERSRWEFLLAQLYELSGKYAESEKYFGKAITHTTDPILEIYARLYSIRVNKDGGENYIEKNIAELLKMAKRDKYADYRDIIYYMAAQMQLERNNIDGALPLLLKSTQFSSNNPAQRNKIFLQLAELNFNRKLYRESYNFYDSIRLDDPSLKDPDGIQKRKELLGRLAANMEIIRRQDSLQRIAAMPEDERKEYVNQLAKQIRKAQGLKDEPITGGSPLQSSTASNLFTNNEARGEWYFYNSTSRQKGANDFKTKWGNRPNVDNWRRSSAVSASFDKNRDTPLDPGKTATAPEETQGSTFDLLYNKLPLTEDKIKISNDSVQSAMFALGKLYIQDVEDCTLGIETMENLRSRFPAFNPMDEVLFNLYYCYNKSGDAAKAAGIKQLMNQRYPQSNYTTIVTTGKNPAAKNNSEATKLYERIYDLFIEGNFDQAVREKKTADSVYKDSYWTPQLLYIESVYYIRQREDSMATNILRNIVAKFPNTPLASKATNLINVLSRRNQIEEELRNMVIERPVDTNAVVTRPVTNIPVNKPVNNPPKQDTVAIKNPQVTQPVVNTNKPVVVDTVSKKPPIAGFSNKPADPHFVVLLLNKVDPVFVNEARNAFERHNKSTYFNKQMKAELVEIDAGNRFLLISPFANATDALTYIDATRPKTSTEIIPWLRGGKYSFAVITQDNLDVLRSNKNLQSYNEFLKQAFPGKFD